MGKFKDTIKQLTSFLPTGRPAGNVLQQIALPSPGRGVYNNGQYKEVVDQQTVKMTEPFGTPIPKKVLERASGWSQLQNLSHQFTMEKVQAALRAAERGDMTLYFGYLRDFIIGNSSVVAELNKRKLSVISQPYTILPASKDAEDVNAAKIIDQLLNNCSTFNDSLIHLMNAIVYPVACLEKIYEPIDEENYGKNNFNLRYKIKKLYPVDYALVTYRLPYLPQGPINIGNQPVIPTLPLTQTLTGRPEDTIYDPDSWEPNLRFWSVFENGLINYSYAYMMAPDPNRHIIYRSDLLSGITRENFGGLGKSLLFLSIMSNLGLDVFLRCLQRYGVPFIVAKVDTSQVDTVEQIMETFGQLNVVNAMAVNKDALIELQEMNYAGAAEAHTRFLDFINNQISLLICGQTLGSHAKSTGLGSGVANLQSDIRQDIIKYDRLSLANTLKYGLFKPLLDINGIKGRVPSITWDGGATPEENLQLSSTLLNLKNAGIEPANESIEVLSEKIGFTLQRMKQQVVDAEEINNTESSNKTDDFSNN